MAASVSTDLREAWIDQRLAELGHLALDDFRPLPRAVQWVVNDDLGGGEVIDYGRVPRIAPVFLEPAANHLFVLLFLRHVLLLGCGTCFEPT